MLKRLIAAANKVKGKYKIAAAILDKRGRVLAIGTNNYSKTHPLQKRLSNCENKIYIHAEISAWIKVKDKSKAKHIVIIRIGKQNKLLPIHSCSSCNKLITKEKLNVSSYF